MAKTLGPASIPFVACVTLLVGLILHILAFASPFWASDDIDDFGLWRHTTCLASGDQRCYRYVRGSEVGAWLNAVRGLESIAIILWSIPLVIIPIYIYVALGLYYRTVMATLALFSLVATACNIVGVIVYGAKIDDESWDFGWCIIVCAVAGAFGILSTLILIVSIFFKPRWDITPDVYEFIDEPIKEPPADPGQVNPVLVAD